jgi:AraC family transcriptional activator of pobA
MHGRDDRLHNSNMVRATSRTAAGRLPSYALYGETQANADVDWLHCESIAERSRLHDWEIQPHRHEALFQILVVRRGAARVHADGRTTPMNGPCVVTVPALSAHGFAFSEDVDGVVFTVVEQHLRQLLSRQPALRARMLQLRCEALPADAVPVVDEAALALRDEHAGTAAWRSLAIDAALVRLVVALQRAWPDAQAMPPDGRGGRAMEQVQRYRAMVEQRYRDQPALTECAAELRITATQLNRACRQVLGRSALAVMHARIVLEAQRELAYTTLTVKQIGLGLGFADAGYFTRFFQRETGATPTAWREAAGRR